MSEGIPVDSVIGAVLQGEAKVVVEVQHIHPIRVGQSGTVEIGFNHIITQQRSLVLNLGRKQGIYHERKLASLKTPNVYVWLCWAGLYLRHQESTSNPLS